MTAMTFEACARAVHAGEMTFATFARETDTRWQRLAAMIRRRWAQPDWHEHADTVQDLLLAAWAAIPRWDERRCARIDRFVVWQAVDKAKKRAHKARGAVLHGSPDRNKPRYEVTFASIGEEREERALRVLIEPAPQEEALARRESATRIRAACRTPREIYAIEAVMREGTVARGALRVYDDPRSRLACRLSSEQHAVRVMATSAARVVARLGTTGTNEREA